MKLKEFGGNYAAVDASKVKGVYVQRQRFPIMRVVDGDYHKTFTRTRARNRPDGNGKLICRRTLRTR